MEQIALHISMLSEYVLRQGDCVVRSSLAIEQISTKMLEGSKQVMVESHNLRQANQERSNGINEMTTGTDQINEAVVKVNTTSNENKENTDVLVSQVSKFKVE